MSLLFVLVCTVFLGKTTAEHCACATGHVHVRDGAGGSHKVLGILNPDDCVSYHGDEVAIRTLKWAHVTYHGKSGYVADKWLKFQDCTLPEHCACTNADEHVRDGAGTNYTIVATLSAGMCLPYRGDMKSANGFHWIHVINYDGKDAWMVNTRATIGKCNEKYSVGSVQQLPGCPRMISRLEWNAREPKRHVGYLPSPPQNVYIHHSGTSFCHDEATCKSVVANFQRYHMDHRGWNDIGLNFIVGEDGNVYVGQGWGTVGGFNNDGFGFCIVGNFHSRVPNDASLNAMKQLIKCGVDNGKLRSDYIVYGHRDVVQTECPGQKFYELIQTWPHYKSPH